MASPAQIAANQLNSRKSTGPTTPRGRAKSSMNALKHGNRSRKMALLREESCAFEDRLRKWTAIGDAQNDIEEYLIYRNVCLSFELDRAERARAERCTTLIENSDEDEIAQAQAVGKQLFFDPAGPTPLYGTPTFFSRKKKTSWNGQAVDPNDPAVLVKILERNAAGCCWLREEWQALRAQLDSPGFWHSHDRLKAIRMLGRQPVEANEDLLVATIFVASHALEPAAKIAFDDLLSDMEDSQRDRYGKTVRERWPDLFRTREKEEWRQILLTLADQHIERLNAKLEVHVQNADAQAERTFARLSFDPSSEGEALRNYLIKCTNGLFRGMATYRKYQARTSGGWGGASGVGRHLTQQDRSESAGREAHERGGSELGADDPFGSGDGLDDGLKRTDVIDPDGVEQHGDFVNETGEIGENAPNEANFDESMSIVEVQESIQVTAHSAAFSALDNDAGQPEEARTPAQGKAQGSGSASGNPKPRAPDSSGRACRGSLPATVSQGERTRLQLEKERLVIERLVEDKLKAGNLSLREILTCAMTLPPSGGRGP